MKVYPTEEFPQLITFNKYVVETRFGDDSDIFMDLWNVYTEINKWNNHTEEWNSMFAKVLGKHNPDILQFMFAKHDAASPPSYNNNNIWLTILNAILYSIQVIFLLCFAQLFCGIFSISNKW